MTAIKNAHAIVPGKILYSVCGTAIVKSLYNQVQCKEPSEYVDKLIVTKKPSYWYGDKRTNSLFFEVIEQNFLTNGYDYKQQYSVRDCGMGGNVYNLNRVFATEVEALEFVNQCIIGVFFDKADTDQYNHIQKEMYGSTPWNYQ